MRRYFPQLAAGHWDKLPVDELTLSLTDDLAIVDVWAGSAELLILSLLRRLWELLQSAPGAPQDQIVIGIQELAPSQAMEMGQIMPEVSP